VGTIPSLISKYRPFRQYQLVFMQGAWPVYGSSE
jgi:hypothetical protein